MAEGIRGSRHHVAKQHGMDEPDLSQAPPEESMNEVATRIPKEVGEAGRRLRHGAAQFGKDAPTDREPPPDGGNETGADHT
ncbi:hypothetical protein [Streptomyces sp. NRRL B-24572]|uniref:hypothetical protein n=1 Tax=Streptomyces sp. NRRL B-24572 TaxID=1962156 RepID=UPI000A37BDBD|nr:hypothetical protein [Streptomyces sp. NRRL B-24572]